MMGFNDITEWHRCLCPISEQIIISGDLSEELPLALRQIEGWKRAGISRDLDTRIEWPNQQLVAMRSSGKPRGSWLTASAPSSEVLTSIGTGCV
jgi:hypothetical protein